MIKNKKIAIIGAGLAGLTLANELSKHNDVTVFEKSRGVAGRIATRRAEPYYFDHGAQFFTAQSEEFQTFCKDLQQNGVIAPWHAKCVEIDGTIQKEYSFDEKNPHFVGVPQMNSVCKFLSKNLNIICNEKIIEIDFQDEKWTLQSESGKNFGDFDFLFLAIPSHQVMELVPQNFQYYNEISQIKMLGCFALMLGFKEDIATKYDVYSLKNSIISWVAVNSSKPQRGENFTIVVHSSNHWAEENIEKDLSDIEQQMMQELHSIIEFENSQINYKTIHRWRYANSVTHIGGKSFFDAKIKLGICGDWLICGKVESAFLSATNLLKNL